MNAYEKAGVDVKAGYESVARIKKHLARTQRPETLGEIGSFGGLFDFSQHSGNHPILVSGTDGVGTKLLLAIESQRHTTIGIDCVAMCVNDVLAQGALPLFFLDYIATGKVDPQVIEEIVAGVAEGCVQAGAALIGGETAEMPDMYHGNHYDLAGFAVGSVDQERLIRAENVQAGDILIGLPASGIHSNGFSLVRQIFFKDHGFTTDSQLPEHPEQTLGELLLTPTRIYVQDVKALLAAGLVNGIAHITGGGFVENLPRMFAPELSASIQLGSWPILPIFETLKTYGQLEEREMYEIFNMGIGLVLAVSPANYEAATRLLKEQGTEFYPLGEVVNEGAEPVVFVEASADDR